MKVEIVPARLVHLEPLVARMREREKQAFVQAGLDPFRVLERELAYSTLSYTGLVDGEVAAVAGAHSSSFLGNGAYIWMTATDLIEQHPVAFYRHTKKLIVEIRSHFPQLYGCVSDGFVKSQRWLEWIGFELSEPRDGVRVFRL